MKLKLLINKGMLELTNETRLKPTCEHVSASKCLHFIHRDCNFVASNSTEFSEQLRKKFINSYCESTNATMFFLPLCRCWLK